MDVGQVYFSIEANNLTTVLAQAQQLESIMNKLDNKHFKSLSRDAARAQRDLDMHEKRQAQIETQHAKTETEHSKTRLNDEKRFGYIQDRNDRHELANVKKIGTAYKDATKARTDASKAATQATSQEFKTAIDGAQKLQKIEQNAENQALKNEEKRLKIAKAELGLKNGRLKFESQVADVAKEATKSLQERQTEMQENMVNFGARMQTLGATLQNITSPFMNVFNGIAMGAGYRLLNTFTNGIEGAFTRFDTMKMYPRMMERMGYATKKFTAEMSRDMLDKSVRGLPTGLGEITEMAQRYTLSLGDMRRGTRLAIATNRAFLASMATESQKYQGMLQLQDLMNGKELQPREWMSLGASMGAAINEVAKAMGAESQEDIRKFRQQLYAGKVDSEEFLNALEKVGNKGGTVYKMAEEYKDTIEALRRNINNAVERMGEHMLTALDELAEATTGKGLVENLKGVTKWIDKLSESAQQWIKTHPKEITDFFNELKSIDWGGILSGFAQMGGYLAKFYADIIKSAGGSGFIKAMININMLGRVIQTIGGLTKGFAGPLSWVGVRGIGWLTTMIKSLTYAGKHTKHIVNLGKHGKRLKDAAETMGSVALTWQDVANKLLNIGSIYVVAQAIKVMSEAMQNFSKVKFTPDMVGSLGTAVTMTGLLTKFVVGMGNVIGASKTLTIGTAIGTGAFYGISKSLEALGNAVGRMGEGMKAGVGALSEIENMELPSPQKVASVGALVQDLLGAFEISNTSGVTAFGRGINAWSKGLQADNIIKISEAMGSIKKLSKIKISSDAMQTAKDNFKAIQDFSIDLMGLFNEEEQAQMEKSGGTSRAFKKGSHTLNPTSYAEWKNKIRDFADTISTLATSFSDITLMLDNMKALNKSYGKIGKGDKGKQETFWKNLRERIGTIAEEMYKFAGNDKESPFWKLQQAASKLKGYDYTIISQALGEIPNMVTAMQEISKIKVDIDETKFEDTMTKVGDFVTQIQKAFAGTNGNLSGGIQGMALDVSALSSAVTGIKQAITDLNSMPNAKDMSGLVASIDSAISQLITACAKAPELQGYVDQLSTTIGSIQELVDSIPTQYKKKTKVKIDGTVDDEVSPKVRKAIRAIRASVNAIPSSITKVVTIRLVGSAVAAGVRGAEAAMAALQNQQHGGRIYRAGGGSLRRGTDTVQAMLTPGEWVMNRHATSMLGDDVLSKLNHLDIRGALNSLSLRAGQIQSKTVNNNSTKNANITVNNYHSDGVGYSRAGRFVRAL